MKYKNIMLTDQGLLALNAPEPINSLMAVEYQQELEQAIKEGVYFKDREETYAILHLTPNEIYPIPDGYEVRVIEQPDSDFVFTQKSKYAILVPKKCEYCGGDGVYIDADSNRLSCPVCTKGAGDNYRVTKEMKDKMKEDLIKIAKTPLFKQQSIEEEAEQSWNLNHIGNHDDYVKGFIAGAKSQAAKIEEEAIAFYKFCNKKLKDNNFFDKVNDGNGTADPKKMYEQFKQQNNETYGHDKK